MMETHNAANYTNVKVNVLVFNTDVLLLLSLSKVTSITMTGTQEVCVGEPGVAVSNNLDYRALLMPFYNGFLQFCTISSSCDFSICTLLRIASSLPLSIISIYYPHTSHKTRLQVTQTLMLTQIQAHPQLLSFFPYLKQ